MHFLEADENAPQQKTNFIGVIIPKINSDSINRMVSGISSTLAGAGYQMLLACAT